MAWETPKFHPFRTPNGAAGCFEFGDPPCPQVANEVAAGEFCEATLGLQVALLPGFNWDEKLCMVGVLDDLDGWLWLSFFGCLLDWIAVHMNFQLLITQCSTIDICILKKSQEAPFDTSFWPPEICCPSPWLTAARTRSTSRCWWSCVSPLRQSIAISMPCWRHMWTHRVDLVYTHNYNYYIHRHILQLNICNIHLRYMILILRMYVNGHHHACCICVVNTCIYDICHNIPIFVVAMSIVVTCNSGSTWGSSYI